ncbi:hypothetical protein O3P69_018091 [Scylla paramamosain]|uniref:Uncharacterized protein n=1 Tax=Scylla paramamosain TaxID=85552 RepID=A0AAW0TKJ3_SCYPA
MEGERERERRKVCGERAWRSGDDYHNNSWCPALPCPAPGRGLGSAATLTLRLPPRPLRWAFCGHVICASEAETTQNKQTTRPQTRMPAAAAAVLVEATAVSGTLACCSPRRRPRQRAGSSGTLAGLAYPAVRGTPARCARTLTHPLHIDETFQIGPSGVAARGTIDYQIITFNHFMRSQITSGRRSANICLISTLNCDPQARPRLDLPAR